MKYIEMKLSFGAKFLIIFIAISCILFSRFYPVYYAYLNTPDGYVYVGQTSSYDPWDINVYVAAIRYGQHGNIVLKNQYTTTDDREAFIYPIYTLTGYIFRFVDPYMLYHILAAISIILICLGVFLLSYKLLHHYFFSVLSMLLITRGGGFGWASVRLVGDAIPSADLFYSNITFMSALQKPHDGIGTLLLILSLVTYYLSTSKHKKKYGRISIISLIVLMFFYPYYIITYAIVTGGHSLILSYLQKTFRPMVYPLIGIVLAGVIDILIYTDILHSGFFMVTGEVIDKVGFLSFFLGYGVFILFFIYVAANKYIPKDRNAWIYLLWWVGVSVFLSYMPIGYSRFFLRGLFFPLVVMSFLYICEMKVKITRQISIFALCFLLPLTAVYVFFDRIQKSNSRDPWQYTLEETADMFNFLRTRKRDGVLSAYRLGSFVPAKTNKLVYLGHLFQTPDAEKRMNNILDFYSGHMTNIQAYQFLIDNNISFVIYSRDEKKLGGHVYPFLKIQFDGKNTKLYSL